jgi:hypothetical protein
MRSRRAGPRIARRLNCGVSRQPEGIVFWRKRKRETEVHVQRAVRFVGEQDGGPERLLKTALIETFRDLPAVERAYLAQVAYPDSASVALCLVAPEERALVDTIGSRFAEVFAQQVHMDILFLRPEQEAELAPVCAPFYGGS